VVYNSAATRARLLDAAYDEFVERGLAGARVDRIATAAAANKQAIYAYFGSKEALFDAVLVDRIGLLADSVPFTPEDLPGYAAGLFDYVLENAGHLRLTMWKQLERTEMPPEEVAAYRAKVDAIAAAQGLDTGSALNLMLITIGIVTSWASAAAELQAVDDAGEAERVARHRAAVVTSVAATVDALRAARDAPAA
jgi:AcrR family transcriptional regulator